MNYRIKLNGVFEFPTTTTENGAALEKFQDTLKHAGTMENPLYDIIFVPGEKGWKCYFYFMASFIFESSLDKEKATAEFLTNFEHIGEPIELDYIIEKVNPRILKKEPGKEPEIIEVDARYLCDLVKPFFGEGVTMERVALNHERTLWMLVDEDGLYKNLPLNFLMSSGSPHFPIQKIVGTALFVESNYADIWSEEIYDYEINDLGVDYQKVICTMFSDEMQKSLKEQFKDYGRGYIIFEKM